MNGRKRLMYRREIVQYAKTCTKAPVPVKIDMRCVGGKAKYEGKGIARGGKERRTKK